jgi:hypothetical protein
MRRVEEVLQRWKSRGKVGRRIWMQRYKHATSTSKPADTEHIDLPSNSIVQASRPRGIQTLDAVGQNDCGMARIIS